MEHRVPPILSILALAAALLAGTAQAQPVPAGSGVLSGPESLKVGPGCGKDAFVLPATVSLAANRTWSATTPEGTYSGTATPASSNGRKWIFTFSGPSLAKLRDVMEAWATDLCDGYDVTIDTLEIVTTTFKVNKLGNEAAVKFKATATGHTVLGDGKGTYKTKLTGPWSPAS